MRPEKGARTPFFVISQPLQRVCANQVFIDMVLFAIQTEIT